MTMALSSPHIWNQNAPWEEIGERRGRHWIFPNETWYGPVSHDCYWVCLSGVSGRGEFKLVDIAKQYG